MGIRFEFGFDSKNSNLILVLGLTLALFLADAEEYMVYKDPNRPVEYRIIDLLGRMTLPEKIGQMVQIDRSVASADVVKDYFIGSILSGGGSVPENRASPETWMKMVNEFQKGALSTRLGIPMIYGIDAVHGQNNVYNATIFPHNVGLGATREPELVKRIGAATALEIRATGIHYTFAPCVAVCRDPRWGRCYESYSEDPEIVKSMTELVTGLQGDPPSNSPEGFPYVAGKRHVVACAKHYVGDGGTTNGANGENAVLDWKNIEEIQMAGYFSSIAKGVSSIMASYSSLNGVKMHANRDMITGYLKNALRFMGFVISDWKGIDLITTPIHANYTYSVEKSINAGIDMVMVPLNYTEFITELIELVDDAVTRILRVKFIMGLFESPMGDESLVNELGSPEHRELAREAVRKSLVLLKNGKEANKPLMPLSKKVARILVAGSHADNLGYQCGGWSIEWQGFSGNDRTSGTTILSAIRATVDPTTEIVYHENPDPQYLTTNSNTFSYAIVIVVISGRPLVIEPYVDTIDALVAAWLPGTEGRGVADVLFGDHGFSGKLPRTWFKRVDQLPMNVGENELGFDPLYPFGFGLTTEPVRAN
ncbi:Beta-glucosidase BoGH3B [Linum perenne]